VPYQVTQLCQVTVSSKHPVKQLCLSNIMSSKSVLSSNSKYQTTVSYQVTPLCQVTITSHACQVSFQITVSCEKSCNQCYLASHKL